jgi:hypothetical protein
MNEEAVSGWRLAVSKSARTCYRASEPLTAESRSLMNATCSESFTNRQPPTANR